MTYNITDEEERALDAILNWLTYNGLKTTDVFDISNFAWIPSGSVTFFVDTGYLITHGKNEYSLSPKALTILVESNDANPPKHYTSHPKGIECIDVTENFSFNIGNAIKYLWRAGLKGEASEDFDKAIWYIQREKERLAKE